VIAPERASTIGLGIGSIISLVSSLRAAAGVYASAIAENA
jgi:hypothetical protein